MLEGTGTCIMSDHEFYPFYTAYSDAALLGEEKAQEDEFRLMKSWYPETAARIQELVEEECQLLDYEGSRIYDEYPDRFMLRQVCGRICGTAEPEGNAQDISGGFLEDLTEVLLYQEIFRRRRRRQRCRKGGR